ncbi:adenosylcobalamin-dependent ribonucleoside-diphosphate reductase [Candidatus Poriferisodalis sp.]|uniref:adenosylcobalamin-dependent ribonucleoside-diphosphate reductase n=1 Tax=Candidatus Poriferisodalis sp. TaxID=3101277 RepID=UPI003B0182DF
MTEALRAAGSESGRRPSGAPLRLRRHFTTAGVHPYETVQWERHNASITRASDGTVAFSQLDVEFPADWSPTAVNIVAQKYFRGTLGTPEREQSLRQVIDRVAGTITRWATDDGYFSSSEEATVFEAELSWLLLHQRVAFNSPVWFNIGVKGVPQQASACFILAVDDEMESILEWYVTEGRIFKGGSGAGVNLSTLRASSEPLSGGGTASGPVSFMRGADASAGTIRSGGKTRRAAKMVLLDADHPDIEAFVWCKAREERKARALAAAGFDMELDGADSFSLQYQNANNSVRLPDEFMAAVEADAVWELRARTSGEAISTVGARDLLHQVAQAAWECADPGVQYSTTINNWHTSPAHGPISASNPCSEYVHLDNSACNLASVNLLPFLEAESRVRAACVPVSNGNGEQEREAADDVALRDFDVDGLRQAARITFIAQDVLVSHADYPTELIGETSRRFRQIGLGFTNLGALLMAVGVPYDSPSARALAASLTALICGEAYATSADLAERLGPFDGFAPNADAMTGVLVRHRNALDDIESGASEPGELGDVSAAEGCAVLTDELRSAAAGRWDHAVAGCQAHGVRNSQATVIAPTGTISFMMDCDTTGIEPDLGLVKHKKLVGGGDLHIVNSTVPVALGRLGYSLGEIADIEAHILETGRILEAPHLAELHRAVFACSIGDDAISPQGHVSMMAACQPFVSGAISKTVNLPESATVADIEALFMQSWRLGLKAVAIYRDNCKVSQPLSVGPASSAADAAASATAALLGKPPPQRNRLPRSRRSRTFSFRVTDCHGFMTVGEYDNGRPGEIFLVVAKQGSTLAGIMDAFAISVSHGLQYGVPLRSYVEAFTNMRFEPAGLTDDPELRIATSIVDYIFRRLALEYLSLDERSELGVLSVDERIDPPLPGLESASVETAIGAEPTPDPPSAPVEPAGYRDAPLCMTCGDKMVRAGSCFACRFCGATSGCG